jgi:hypothetical protein
LSNTISTIRMNPFNIFLPQAHHYTWSSDPHKIGAYIKLLRSSPNLMETRMGHQPTRPRRFSSAHARLPSSQKLLGSGGIRNATRGKPDQGDYTPPLLSRLGHTGIGARRNSRSIWSPSALAGR